jgi:hypothetical protein
MEFILVTLGLEGEPEHPAEGHYGRVELVTTRVSVIIPRESYVREPKQERKDPEILVWGKPITRCKKQSKRNTFYIKGKRPTWKDSTSHFLILFTIKNENQNNNHEENDGGNFEIKLRNAGSRHVGHDYVGQCILV